MAKRKSRTERRSFNDEYRQQVLELIRSGDRSESEVCQGLDLTESAVRRWIKLDQKSNGIMTQNSLSETDQQELHRLRTENKHLKTERDILKNQPSLRPTYLLETHFYRAFRHQDDDHHQYYHRQVQLNINY